MLAHFNMLAHFILFKVCNVSTKICSSKCFDSEESIFMKCWLHGIRMAHRYSVEEGAQVAGTGLNIFLQMFVS